MTFAKARRASMLPSFSLSAFGANSDSEKRTPDASLHQNPGSDDGQLKQRCRQDGTVVGPKEARNEAKKEAKKEARKEAKGPKEEGLHKGRVSSGRPSHLRTKSKIWGARVSSFFPPLLSQNADPKTTGAKARSQPKAIVSSSSSCASSASSSPTEKQSPPPPYRLHASLHESRTSAPNDGTATPTAILPRTTRTATLNLTPTTTTSTTTPTTTSTTTPAMSRPGPRGPADDAPTPSPSSSRSTLSKFEPPVRTTSRTGTISHEAPKQSKLKKSTRDTRRRSKSLSLHASRESLSANHSQVSLRSQDTPPVPSLRERRSFSAQADAATASSTHLAAPANPSPRSVKEHHQSPSRGRPRRSWLPGGARSRANSVDVDSSSKSYAWIISDQGAPVEYNPSLLNKAEKVPELWNETGTVLVFLYPRSTGCGPSFKVPEFTISSSYVFNQLLQVELESLGTGRDRSTSFGGRDCLSVHDAARITSPPVSPLVLDSPGCMRLYLPAAPSTASGHLATPGRASQPELDRLINIRNLFAFLTGQPLVGTVSRPSIFKAFLAIADLLQEFGFSGSDDETFGEAVDLSFGFYSEQLGLADCRHSREKTIEALILGERMRCLDLYNEAFAHAAGKYSAILELGLPLFDQVSPHTRQRVERASFDLVNRRHNVNQHLEQFEFPSLFAGIANSTSIPELKHVRFKVWKSSFSKMRQFVLNYYKSTFGNWPPKASSKKNSFMESGLNRLVLKVLYSDMCALYDLLVDRNKLTSRVIDEVPAISDAADKMSTSALRNIMSEFDRSKPPVLPPIPYDLPQLPAMTAIHETFNSLSSKSQNRLEKKIKEHELHLILNKAYNYDINSIKLPFLDQFKAWEAREGRGKLCHDLMDQRIGYWLFLYVVLQSLPMLVVDAPGLTYTEGVEYFLCEPPMGNPPWIEDREVRKMWYEVTGGGGRLVELSTDAVMFSVEATYHRSHCWLAAKKWEGAGDDKDDDDYFPPEEPAMSPLEPPRHMFPGDAGFSAPSPVLGGPSSPSSPPSGSSPVLRPRTLSPALNRNSQAWRSSIAMGLEPVPMEPPNVFGPQQRSSSLGPRPSSSHVGSRTTSLGYIPSMSGRSTPVSQHAISGATFDDILGATENKKSEKKKSRFF